MECDRKMNRREFIRDISIIGAGVTLGPILIGGRRAVAEERQISKLVIATNKSAVNGMKLDSANVRKTVDAAIMKFTGQKNLADAWRSIFPSISPKDTIAIKVNCINSQLPSHPEVVDAIVEGLKSAGVKENNIIIWDRSNGELIACGYKYNVSTSGVRCFGTDEKGWGYDKEVDIAGQSVRLSKILMSADHLINVPVLKDHGGAIVTLSMKNHYGSVDNPGALHDNQCDPYIAKLNEINEIREKTRLIVLDAFMGIYQGGPGGSPQFVYNSVIVGKDPVAVDFQGWRIIEEERKKNGKRLPTAAHIVTASKLGLGTNNPDNISIEKVEV